MTQPDPGIEARARELADAVKRIEARLHPHYGIEGATDSRQLARDVKTLSAALSTPSPPPGWRGKRWRHVARGTEYEVIEAGVELQDARGAGVEEGALLTIYRGDDGNLWARRASEFGDGRFVPVAPAAPTGVE